jgi:hypothetical protein
MFYHSIFSLPRFSHKTSLHPSFPYSSFAAWKPVIILPSSVFVLRTAASVASITATDGRQRIQFEGKSQVDLHHRPHKLMRVCWGCIYDLLKEGVKCIGTSFRKTPAVGFLWTWWWTKGFRKSADLPDRLNNWRPGSNSGQTRINKTEKTRDKVARLL